MHLIQNASLERFALYLYISEYSQKFVLREKPIDFRFFGSI